MPITKERGTQHAGRAPGAEESVKEQLLESPFATRIMEETKIPEYAPVFKRMTTAISGFSELERDKVLSAFTDGEKGPMWAGTLLAAVNQLRTGPAAHILEELGARAGAGVSAKMASVSSIMSGLTMEQTKAFLDEVRKNPLGCEPGIIADRIRAAVGGEQESG